MSGIVGMLQLDRSQVDRELLTALTGSMAYLGPDQQRTWLREHVGFGHSLLKTTEESERETQPFTLDHEVWIVADARIDAQRDLIDELRTRGEDVKSGVTDVELVIRAYRCWGAECVTHLIGDFSFAIWDGPARRLFCARDQLGVRPFYFAQRGQLLIFSNSLSCIRQHPAVSDALNDQAIADFLLFELNQDVSTTAFADIHRLPPAHCATWDDRGCSVQRYWTMPIEEPVFFAHHREYVESFSAVVRAAVRDRLRQRAVSVFMSGGLDSTSLAALASELLRERRTGEGVKAFTTLVPGLDGDEGHFARLAAAHLRIPISEWDLTRDADDSRWEAAPIRTPEPVANPCQLVTELATIRSAGAHSRVGFYGEGPDNALAFEWQAYLAYLLRTGRTGRLVSDVFRHVLLHQRIPLLPTIPRMWRARRQQHQWNDPYPSWLEPAFETRLRLRERWDRYRRGAHASSDNPAHPIRPVSYAGLNSPLWDALFRGFDPEATSSAFEVRHPYVDLRVLRYCLSLPAVPWCRRKLIVRHAMRGKLPEQVLQRDKTPLSSDPLWERARRFGLPPLRAVPQLAAYVDSRRLAAVTPTGIAAFRTYCRARALNYWLSAGAKRP